MEEFEALLWSASKSTRIKWKGGGKSERPGPPVKWNAEGTAVCEEANDV